MIRHRLASPSVALLGLLLVFAPARGQDTGVKADDAKRMVELLDRIDKRLATQQSQSETLMEMVRKDVKDLRDEVARLQRDVSDLRRTPSSGTSTSNYPSTSLSPAAAMPTARIRLINTYPMPMTTTVNGMSYTLQPYQTHDVSVPAGTAMFQVHQLGQSPQTRSLSANETLTLIHPL